MTSFLPPPSSAPGPYRPTLTSPAGRVGTQPHLARWHVAEQGDTLASLARRYYNNQREWVRIYNANRAGRIRPDKTMGNLVNPNDVPIGERIHIP